MSQKTYISLDRQRTINFTFTNTCMFEEMTGQSFLMFMQTIKAAPSAIKFSDVASLTYCGLYNNGQCDLSRQEFNGHLDTYAENHSVLKLVKLVGEAIHSSIYVKKMIDDLANEQKDKDKADAGGEAEKK